MNATLVGKNTHKEKAKATVLFVDDDPPFLELLAEQMKHRFGQKYEVLTCSSVGAALVLLKSTSVSLICLDLSMPVVDGIQALKLISKKHPLLRKVILTSVSDDIYRQASLEQGADFFLQKPRTAAEYDSVFMTIDILLEEEEAGGGIIGTVRRISMPDLIQMECTSQSSSVCYVQVDGQVGRIFICKGEIVHAEYADLVGFEAFKRLMSMNSGSFDVKNYEEPLHRSIDVRWDYLLLECARSSDEEAAPDLIEMDEVKSLKDGESAVESEISVGESKSAAATEPEYPTLMEMLCLAPDGSTHKDFKVLDLEGRHALMDRILQCGERIGALVTVPELQRVKTKGTQSLSVIRMVQAPPGEFERFEGESDASRMLISSRSGGRFLAQAALGGMSFLDMDRLGKKLSPVLPP